MRFSLGRLLRNILSTYVRVAVVSLVTFVLTPLLYHRLHAESYGVLAFVLATVALTGALDLGLYNALIRHVSDLAPRNQPEELRRLVSSCFYVLLGLGVALAGLLAFLSRSLASFFRLDTDGVVSGALALTLVGASLAFQLPSTALRASLMGCEDYHLDSGVESTTQLLHAGFIVYLLLSGYGLTAVAAVFPFTALLRLVGLLAVARWARIPFTPRPAEVNWNSLRRVRPFASLVFLEDILMNFFTVADSFLAARLLPLPQLALLRIARRFPWALGTMVHQGLWVCFPVVSGAAARGDREISRRFVLLSSRYLLGIVVVVGAALFIWADVLLQLWVGPEVVAEGVPIFRAYLVLSAFAGLQEISLTLLYGLGRIRFALVVSAGIVAAVLVFGVWASLHGGLLGLALVYAVGQTLAALLLGWRALALVGIVAQEWWKKAVAPAVWAGLLVLGWSWLSHRWFPHNWPGLLSACALGLILFLPVFIHLATGGEPGGWRERFRRLVAEIE